MPQPEDGHPHSHGAPGLSAARDPAPGALAVISLLSILPAGPRSENGGPDQVVQRHQLFVLGLHLVLPR